MKKSEEIKKQISALDNEIKAIQLKIRERRVALLSALEAESPFDLGEKVQLYKGNYNNIPRFIGEGIFAGYVVGRYSDIQPRVFKVKKDGSVSKNEWSKYDFSTIEKIAK